jgi:hypothetical protein
LKVIKDARNRKGKQDVEQFRPRELAIPLDGQEKVMEKKIAVSPIEKRNER